MPPRISGVKENVIRQLEENFETDRYGVDTMTLKVEIPDAIFPAAVLRDFATHPRFNSMALSRRSGQRNKPGFWSVTYTFEGFLFESPQPVYELQSSLSEAPIQLHPSFEEFAGTPSAPLNGAIFIDPDTGKQTNDDTKGVWREFKAGTVKGGVEAYLVPGAEWREITFSTTRPSALSALGKIDPPSGPNPTLADHNWLFWSQTYTRRGSLYQTTKTWKLSGKGGWDPDIY